MSFIRNLFSMKGLDSIGGGKIQYSRDKESDFFENGMIEGGLTSGGFSYKGKRKEEWSVLDGDQSYQNYVDDLKRIGNGQIGTRYFNPVTNEPYSNKFMNIEGKMYKTDATGAIIKVDNSYLKKELELTEKEEKRIWKITKMFKSDAIMAKILTMSRDQLKKVCDVGGLVNVGWLDASSPLAKSIDSVVCLPSISSMYPKASQEEGASLMKLFYICKRINPIISDPEYSHNEGKKAPSEFNTDGNDDEESESEAKADK